jgi:hypothetical protein
MLFPAYLHRTRSRFCLIRETREQQEASRDVRSAPEHHLSRYFDWKVKKLKIAEAGRAIWLDTRAMHPADGHKKGGARIGVKSK